MQSLAKRHEDRARRIAANRNEFNGGTAPAVGTVALAYRNFAALRSRLGEDENVLAELNKAMEGIDGEFAGGYRSLAEAPDGSGQTMAGIGVVNPAVVPMQAIAADEDAGANGGSFKKDPAWGETAPVTVSGLPEAPKLDPGSNLAGQSLKDQLGQPSGWGTGTPTTASPEEANSGNGGGTDNS